MTEANPANPTMLPTAEQVKHHLNRHQPTGPSRIAAMAPLLAIGLFMGLILAAGSSLVIILGMWIGLLGILGSGLYRLGKMRRLEQQIQQIQEHTILRRYLPGLRRAWELLPRLTATPALHGRAIAFIAHCLDQLKAYEAAIVSYDYLIDHMPENHPNAVQLQLHRAISQLHADYLADADTTLRQMRGQSILTDNPVAKAIYHHAILLQQTLTNHFDQAIDDQIDLVETLKPMGLEAAYGHAMLALAHHRAWQHNADQLNRQQAEKWWSTATVLMPPEQLIHRIAPLSPLRELPATRWPWAVTAEPGEVAVLEEPVDGGPA